MDTKDVATEGSVDCTHGPSAQGDIMVQGIQLYIVITGQDGLPGPKGTRMQIYMHTLGQ